MNVIDWGIIPYQEAWDKQEAILEEQITRKKNGLNTEDTFILCEHPHVYTLGKHGHQSNLLVSESYLRAQGADFVHTNRGGDITYHGPGQIVGYPIFDLERLGLGLKKYIYTIEECIIRTIQHYGIKGERVDGATGVWIEPQTPHARKIAAIGVRCSHYITMHGFALNVNTDLQRFKEINPCGFIDKGVCSIASECQKAIDEKETKQILVHEMKQLFTI